MMLVRRKPMGEARRRKLAGTHPGTETGSALRRYQRHMLAMCDEAGGDVRIDIRTREAVNELVRHAAAGDAEAVHTLVPVTQLLVAFTDQGQAMPCYACGEAVSGIMSVGGMVTVSAFTLDPVHVVGGVLCDACIALPLERLKADVLAVLHKVGVDPGPVSGRNLHPDGGRA
jgi:hypothetical protein